MKNLFLIFALLFSNACAERIASTKDANASPQPTATVDNSANANAFKTPSYTDEPSNADEIERLPEQNAAFEIVPDEFKRTDFANFKYPSTRLTDGESIKEDKIHLGGQTFSLADVYYIDLTGDAKKEAIVFLSKVSCGGSCDGGNYIIHFYSSVKNKTELLDYFETGSGAGGCFLKSFTVKNKKITIKQFGRCTKRKNYDPRVGNVCKFCVKDLTRSVYSLKNSGLFNESSETFETPGTNIMNYSPLINLSE